MTMTPTTTRRRTTMIKTTMNKKDMKITTGNQSPHEAFAGALGENAFFFTLASHKAFGVSAKESCSASSNCRWHRTAWHHRVHQPAQKWPGFRVGHQLVGGFFNHPLWKIWVRQLGWGQNPNISGKIQNWWLFQTTNQSILSHVWFLYDERKQMKQSPNGQLSVLPGVRTNPPQIH